MNTKLIFQSSYFLIPLCLLVGIAYAWFLYSQKKGIADRYNKLLAAFRALLVSIICFLLLNPLIQSISNQTLKPLLVIGIDNSSSQRFGAKGQTEKLLKDLETLKSGISEEKYSLEVRNLAGENIENNADLKFQDKKTDLGRLFNQINEEFDGQNIQKVILLSDGIINTGVSPLNYTYNYSIDALAYGDTSLQKDISIKGLTANKLAYLGNDFPVQIDISATLFEGKSTIVQISKDNAVLARQNIGFRNQDDFQTINFTLPAKTVGKTRYTIQVLPLPGEKSTKNNTRDLVIDVIDGKEKILVLAANPHPDLKAFRSILSQNELFEVEIRNVATDKISSYENYDFDLLILHQLPNIKASSNDVLSKLLARNKPVMFVLGAQSELSRFNGMQEVLGINGSNGKTDKITSRINASFNRFKLPEDYNQTLEKLPPINAVFGEYRIAPGSDVVAYQKVGNIQTDRPLLVLNTNVNRKTAILTAEGLWLWRLEEYYENENHAAVDELLTKTLQLISVKDNKEKLRVYPIQDEFDIDETIIFQTEAYNDLFERVDNTEIKLVVKASSGKTYEYNYGTSSQSNTFEISNLPAGLYTFTAEGQVLGKKHQSQGQFVVRDQDLSCINTAADFNLLRSLSQKNNGQMYLNTQIEDLLSKLNEEEVNSKIVSRESLREIIDLKWILPLLILLISLEWAVRKYLGTY